jgi:hypothetical protein
MFLAPFLQFSVGIKTPTERWFKLFLHVILFVLLIRALCFSASVHFNSRTGISFYACSADPRFGRIFFHLRHAFTSKPYRLLLFAFLAEKFSKFCKKKGKFCDFYILRKFKICFIFSNKGTHSLLDKFFLNIK